MNKREVVWLIVRLIGLYLGYLAIVALFGLVSSVWTLAWTPSKGGGEGDNARIVAEQPAGIPGIRTESTPPRAPARVDTTADLEKRAAFKEILWHIFLTVLYGGIGFYMLVYGGTVFNILMRENKPGERKEREPESILLNLTD